MQNYIAFDDIERGYLLEILNERLESLREEVNHTDSRAFKEELKGDRGALQLLINKIHLDESKAL